MAVVLLSRNRGSKQVQLMDDVREGAKGGKAGRRGCQGVVPSVTGAYERARLQEKASERLVIAEVELLRQTRV
jgi:hypothetical protein